MRATRHHILFAPILLATAASPASAQQTTINNATLTVPPAAIPGGDDLFVGTTGTGLLNIVTGGVVTTFEATLGQFATGVGTVNVTGPAATLNTLSNFDIGALGTGALNISGGGVVTSSAGTDIADGASSTGAVSISGTGSVWNADDVTLGGFGSGTLTVSNGGVFNGATVILGSSTGSVGTINVSGPGSQFNMTGTLSIGDDGDGTFNVTNGATLNVDDIYISDEDGQGVFNVSGGSTVISDDVVMGYFSNFGKGTANVSGAGTTWTIGGGLIVGDEGGAGELNITGGAVVTVAGTMSMGNYDQDIARGDILISGNGSRLTVTGDAIIGDERPGIIVVSNRGLFQVSGTSTISGQQSAPSALTITGTGSQFVTDALEVGEDGQGTLRILSGGLATSTGAILGGGLDGIGAVVVNAGTWNLSANNLVVGNDGAGAVTVQGGGRILGAAQTIVGGNVGSTGALNFGAGVNGAAAAPGTLATPQVLFAGGDGSVNFNLLGAFAFTPELAGNGAVNVLAGTTSFGTNSPSYSGDVTITGGRANFNGLLPGDVSVSGTGIAGGGGTINSLSAFSGGTVAPGTSPGTLNVVGGVSFAPGSTYAVEVSGARADLIAAGGAATLTGGTVSVSGTPSLARYAILTAAGGVTGTFDTLTGSSAFLEYSLDYDPAAVYLVVDVSSLTVAARTPNQFAVARALNQFPDTNPLFAAVVALDFAGARQAFDALSGEIHPSLGTALIDDNRYVREAITGRLIQAYHGNGGLGGRATDPITTASTDDGAGYDLVGWTRAFGAWGQYDETSADRDLGGFITGVDAGLPGGWRAGLATGYMRTNLSTDELSSAEVDSYVLGAYAGGGVGDGVAFRSGGTWVWNDIDTSRTVAFPGFLEQENADYDGNAGQIFGELAYPIVTPVAVLEPFAGLAYVHLDMDGFTESGPVAGLTSGGLDMNVGYGTLGVRAGTTMEWDGTTLIPHASLAWQYAFGETTPEQALAFASTGIGMVIQGAPIARNSALVELGVDIVADPGATLGLSYIGQYSDDFSDTGLRGRLTWRF